MGYALGRSRTMASTARTARPGEDGQGENVERAELSGSPTGADSPAGERYLLLADISGYTGFMAGVEQAHGVDFSAGIPAAYSVLGDLLHAVVQGLTPEWSRA